MKFSFIFSVVDLVIDNDPENNWRYFSIDIFNLGYKSLFKISVELVKPFFSITVSFFFMTYCKSFRLGKSVVKK